MKFYLIIEKVFLNYFFTLTFAVLFFSIFKIDFKKINKKLCDENKEKVVGETKEDNKLTHFMIGLTLLFWLVIIYFVGEIGMLYILLVPLIIWTWLDYMNKLFYDMGVIRNIVQKPKKGSIYFDEWESIIGFGLFIYLCILSKIPITLLNVIDKIENKIIADILLVIFLVIITTICIFVLLTLMAELAVCFLSIIERFRIKYIINDLLIKMQNYCEIKKFKWEYLVVIFWKTKKDNKISICLFSIPIIVIDLILKTMQFIYFYILKLVFLSILIIRRIAIVFISITNFISSRTERVAFVFMFRASFILSLIIVVLFNRYQPFFKINDASTVSLEFLASAIIIPLLLSWILDMKRSK